MLMTDKNNPTFDPAAFLAHAGLGRRIIEVKPKQTFFTQGDPADSVFYLQSGRARLPSFRRTAKRPQSRFSPPATSLERSPSRRCLDCACPRPLP